MRFSCLISKMNSEINLTNFQKNQHELHMPNNNILFFCSEFTHMDTYCLSVIPSFVLWQNLLFHSYYQI